MAACLDGHWNMSQAFPNITTHSREIISWLRFYSRASRWFRPAADVSEWLGDDGLTELELESAWLSEKGLHAKLPKDLPIRRGRSGHVYAMMMPVSRKVIE